LFYSKKKKKGTPPWYVNIGGHPMESVNHGLCKEKRWRGVPNFIKEHKSANLSHKLAHFCMEDSKNPIAVVDKDNHLSKPNFISLFYK
jgi:hypothetical protein